MSAAAHLQLWLIASSKGKCLSSGIKFCSTQPKPTLNQSDALSHKLNPNFSIRYNMLILTCCSYTKSKFNYCTVLGIIKLASGSEPENFSLTVEFMNSKTKVQLYAIKDYLKTVSFSSLHNHHGVASFSTRKLIYAGYLSFTVSGIKHFIT